MVQNTKIQKLKFLVFFNNNRGIEIIKIFLKKKFNFEIVLTKKFLNREVIKFLSKKKLPYKIITNLKNFSTYKKYDIFLAAGFPHIFSKNLINKPKLGVINLHAGPLPKYRGGSPLSWQIINGEKKLGVTFFKMNENLDMGKILLKKYFVLNKNENILNAQKKANKIFAKYILIAIGRLIKKKYLKNKGKSNYYFQRSPRDAKINVDSINIKKIRNYIRALYPYYTPPYIQKNSKKIYIKNFSKISGNSKKKYLHRFKCKDAEIGLTKKDIII